MIEHYQLTEIIEHLRIQKKLSYQTFLENIVSERSYRRYVNEGKPFNFEILIQLVDKLQMKIRHYDGIELELESQLSGPHQAKNLVTALEVVRTLSDAGWNVTREHFKRGIKSVVTNTGLKGRWQVLGRNPLIIADTGHNLEGLEPNIKRLLSNRKPEQLHFVWGMVNDKDVSKTMAILPQGSSYYFCKPDVPRGLKVSILVDKAIKMNLKNIPFPSVSEALKGAKVLALQDDIIYVGGSTFVVAEVV